MLMAKGLTASDIVLSYGGVRALDGVNLSVDQGTIHAVIGPNGAGKTSLLNVLAGFTRMVSGTVRLGDQRIDGLGPSEISRAGIARTFQNIQLFDSETAFTNVLLGAESRARTGVIRTVLGTRAVRRGIEVARQRVAHCLELVGLDSVSDHRAGSLPYGRQRMLEIARALATQPEILLLDEPGAGLNATEKRELASILRAIIAQGIGIVLVEHDMDLVMGISDRVCVLNFGEVIAVGTAEEVSSDPRVVEAYLGKHADGK